MNQDELQLIKGNLLQAGYKINYLKDSFFIHMRHAYDLRYEPLFKFNEPSTEDYFYGLSAFIAKTLTIQQITPTMILIHK